MKTSGIWIKSWQSYYDGCFFLMILSFVLELKFNWEDGEEEVLCCCLFIVLLLESMSQ